MYSFVLYAAVPTNEPPTTASSNAHEVLINEARTLHIPPQQPQRQHWPYELVSCYIFRSRLRRRRPAWPLEPPPPAERFRANVTPTPWRSPAMSSAQRLICRTSPGRCTQI